MPQNFASQHDKIQIEDRFDETFNYSFFSYIFIQGPRLIVLDEASYQGALSLFVVRFIRFLRTPGFILTENMNCSHGIELKNQADLHWLNNHGTSVFATWIICNHLAVEPYEKKLNELCRLNVNSDESSLFAEFLVFSFLIFVHQYGIWYDINISRLNLGSCRLLTS